MGKEVSIQDPLFSYTSKSFIHLSSKHFLSTRYGSVEQGSEKTAVNRASISPHAEVYSQPENVANKGN